MDKRKIVLMTKLAIEEKVYLKQDEKITSYYPEDYVYINNFKTRLLIIILMGIGVIGHVFLRIQSGMLFPSTGEEVFVYYIIPYGSIVILAVLLYTVLSTMVYKKRYNQAQRRIANYRKTLRDLEEYELDKSKEEVAYEVKRNYTDA